MYEHQYKYYERNKEELQKKARKAYHDKKLKDTFFTIRHYEEGINPFSNNNINGMGTSRRLATG
jgi:hypothetical protein|tara:strand:- start:632 stop:823 length:192 start_codon:yes stop_codon:yes gene_type:complete